MEAVVKGYVRKMKTFGFKSEKTGSDAIKVFDPDGQVVYSALRKGGKGQPWIVLCYNSAHITWG